MLLQFISISFDLITIIISSKADTIALIPSIIIVILKSNITYKIGIIKSNNPVNLFA